MDTKQTGCVGHTVFKCSLPAPEFGVVDVFKFLFADAGYPVSQKFNEVQSGFKRVFKRRHVEVLLQAAVTDCRLTESEEVHLLKKNASVSSSINVTPGCKCASTGKKFPRAVYFFCAIYAQINGVWKFSSDFLFILWFKMFTN